MLAQRQDIPAKFLEGISAALRRGGPVVSQRGAEGGYRLARPASEVALADVFGQSTARSPGCAASARRPPPATVRQPPQGVWIFVRASSRAVLEQGTLPEMAGGNLPGTMPRLSADPDAWRPQASPSSQNPLVTAPPADV